jgi:glycosyltransferase involved in cell wall biosynthesis
VKHLPGRLTTIFLVSPFVPFPPARGIELRIYRLLKWMKKAGYKVVLIVLADAIEAEALAELRSIVFAVHWTRPAFRTRLGRRLPLLRGLLWEPVKALARVIAISSSSARELPAPFISHPSPPLANAMNAQRPLGDDQIKAWFAPDRLVRLVAALARKYKPHAVIAEYIFSTPVFAVLPEETIKIIDTIDVFSRKEDQVLAFGIVDPLACSEEEERRQLLRGDVIVAIQSREARLLKALVPQRDVVLAGIDFDIPEIADDLPEPGRIVVVASDNALNVHGFGEFLSECWPVIKARYPSAHLHVVGRVGDMCRIDDAAIKFSGWIDDLDAVYRDASIVINPTIAGTGLKIKSVQALAHGKPLVAWTNGVEGLDYEGAAPYIECRSWPDFADAVVRLLESDDERRTLAARALAYARREFGADKVYGALRACIEESAKTSVRDMRQFSSASPGATAVP